VSNLSLYALTVAVWGSSWLAITFQLGTVSPEVSVAYRMLLAAALALGWCLLRGMPMRFGLRAHGAMALLGALLFSLNYHAFYVAIGYIPSGLAAVTFSTIVGFNIVLGALVLGQPIRRRAVVGAAVGLCGMALVFWHDVRDLDFDNAGLTGLAWSLLATLLASLGNMVSARQQRAGVPVAQSNAFGLLYGALLSSTIVVLGGEPVTFEWTVRYLSGLLYLSLFASVLGFYTYLTLLGRIGADRAAYAMVLFPLVALLLSTLFEGYRWTGLAMIGVPIVLLGNVIVLTRIGAPRRARA